MKYTTVTLRVGWGGDEADDDAEEGGSAGPKRAPSSSFSASGDPVGVEAQSTPVTPSVPTSDAKSATKVNTSFKWDVDSFVDKSCDYDDE